MSGRSAEEIYRGILLSHSREPRFQEEAADFPLTARVRNPLCGDEVQVFAQPDEDGNLRWRFSAQACLLCVAASSIILTQLNEIPGKQTWPFLEALRQALTDGVRAASLPDIPEIEALLSVRELPGRLSCVRIVIDAGLEIGKMKEK